MILLRFKHMRNLFVVIFLLLLFGHQAKATHVMGGDLTWTCQGGSYVFQLVFYRDCNGADVNPVSENIEVWNHASINQISVLFVSREDVSPICTEVPGGPQSLACGNGPNNGNGLGAIEKIIYRSNPIVLGGTPPAAGWIFTYDNFSRSGSITNLQNPNSYGITLVAKIFNTTGIGTGCVDNSPQFLQDPYFVSCVGEDYEYNMNAVDPDLDSLAVSFSHPLDYLNGQTYNPPSVPAQIPYVGGFSANSPTPGTSMNPGNIPAQIDPSSGNITFLSFNAGNYVVKVKAESYRQGVLIASVEREMQLIVQVCNGVNAKPSVAGPFAGAFETTVDAGTLVNFTINSTDLELLQDGTAQSNLLTTTGLMYSSDYTSGLGCLIPPCATLNSAPTITGIQGVSADFSWQTSCDHLVNPFGYAADTVPYHFVFKVQDDYCPVPKVTYKTITIKVVNPGVIDAPQIDCTQGQANGDLVINWTPVADPNGSFVAYEIHSVQAGLISTIPLIGTNTATVPGGALAASDYFIAVVSGCGGNTVRYSDTIQNIFLNLTNPANGTAVLQWNEPSNPIRAGMANNYDIMQEYPTTVWQSIGTPGYPVGNWLDTIRVCGDDLNYQIVLNDAVCPHTSNIAGDFFEDMITPDIPVIEYVTIDTLTGTVTIEWNVNGQSDTYGYVIYQLNDAGIPIELDTVWGINSTTYTFNPGAVNGVLSFTVAAFDSCFTSSIPPTYQTSAKADVHSTMFLTHSYDICADIVELSWTNYVGWDAVDNYEILYRENGSAWTNGGNTTSTNFDLPVNLGENYCYVIKANHASGKESFSQVSCSTAPVPGQPDFHYLSNVSVLNDSIHISHYIDDQASVQSVVIQKQNNLGVFEDLATLTISGPNLSLIDSDVEVNDFSYIYRAQLIDSCGKRGALSNTSQSILLQTKHDDLLKLNYLYWNPYSEYDGSIIGYRIYRGLNGELPQNLIATIPDGHYYFEDDVNGVVSNGKICYRVEAIEAMNSYGFSLTSFSNTSCIVQEPLVYIPNAFMPGGINKKFLPILNDFDPESYELLIFNRWGDVIFKSDLYDEGWDGTVQSNGKMAQTGTYLYVLTIKDGAGNEIMKRGHVSLLN